MKTNPRCLYDSTFADFLGNDDNYIFGTLCDNYHGEALTTTREAWKAEISILKQNMLCTLFRNDATSARPEGSMEVQKVVWWKHSCPNGNLSSAKVHRTLSVRVDEDGQVNVSVKSEELPEGIEVLVIDGE